MPHQPPFRIPIQRRGFLGHGQMTTLCQMLDLTERGFQFTADLPLGMSDLVALEIHLEGNEVIHCGLLVTQAHKPNYEGRITMLSPEDQDKLGSFVGRIIRLSMGEA